MNLLTSSFRWLLSRAALYVLVLLILGGGAFAVTEFREFRQREARLPEVRQLGNSLHAEFDQSRVNSLERAKQLQGLPAEQLKRRIKEVEQSIHKLPNLPQSTFDFGRALMDGDLQPIRSWARLEIEREMLGRERDYLLQLLALADRVQAGRELERLRQEIVRYNEVHEVIRAAMNPPPRAELEARLATWRDFLDRAWQNYRAKKGRVSDAEIERLRLEIVKGNVGYDNVRYVMNPPPSADIERELLLWKERLAETWRSHEQLKASIADRPALVAPALQLPTAADQVPQLRIAFDAFEEAERDRHWIAWVLGALKPFMWPAFLVLVVAMLTPYAIRSLFYVLAGLLNGHKGVALLPASGGRLLTGRELPGQASGAASSVSCRVTVDQDSELLLHPEYRQSLPNDCDARTQWILNRAIPLSSFAAGLYALTRIRAASPQTVVVSSTRDPLSEVSLITIPAGSSAVLLPRHIVGVLQQRDVPLRITRHWRLFSLHAWLTLQLRYLVFHGPVTLVVKGCRGVRVEPAELGRSLNPAATIGFSANLCYASRRCETFWGYLSGQQPLLNDSFAGGSGVYVYQEMPQQRRGGLFGRGLEGLFDAVLKPLGI